MPALAENEPYGDAEVAAMLGLHLVTQVLDEACAIAHASQNIGWPWTCVLSVYRDAKKNKLPVLVSGRDKTYIITQSDPAVPEDDISVALGNIAVAQGDSAIVQGDIIVTQDEKEVSIEVKDPTSNVATSTPHKEKITKMKPGSSFIGQGDEEFDMRREELNNSTSMFINNLFDMSEVEEEIFREEAKSSETEPMINAKMVTKLMNSLFNDVVDIATDQIVEIRDMTTGQIEVIEVVEIDVDDKLTGEKESSYSFLVDAYEGDIENNNVFYVDDDIPSSKDDGEVECEKIPILIEEPTEDEVENKIEKCNVTRYEDAYLTLNRDYEVCSDDDGYPILQDPEELIMQDVELWTEVSDSNLSSHFESEETKMLSPGASGGGESRKSRTKIEKCDVVRYEDSYVSLNRDCEPGSDEDGYPILQDPKELVRQDVELSTDSSEDNQSSHHESEERRKLAATSGISGASGKSRTSLMSRCRSQGARLLGCLRGWWRRKAPGKRKEARIPGAARGLCPLSPNARRRASSLLDHRHLCSPVPSSSTVWKFNTVNEALVNSSRWREYTFEIKPSPCDED